MLSRELMGIFCLSVVWVTALLVAAAALQDLRDLKRIATRAERAIVGTASSDLAEWWVEQTGRAVDAREAIAFHDRTFHGEVFAAKVRASEDDWEICPSKTAQVWTALEERERAASCEDDATFDAAYARARKAKGLAREVRVRISKGARVYVIGRIDGKRVTPEIVSTIDPARFCVRKSLLLKLFIPLELAVCAVATAVALVPPHFGPISIAGAIACFAFFLGVTPIAVNLRENARRPHEAFLRTEWVSARLRSEKPVTQR